MSSEIDRTIESLGIAQPIEESGSTEHFVGTWLLYPTIQPSLEKIAKQPGEGCLANQLLRKGSSIKGVDLYLLSNVDEEKIQRIVIENIALLDRKIELRLERFLQLYQPGGQSNKLLESPAPKPSGSSAVQQLSICTDQLEVQKKPSMLVFAGIVPDGDSLRVLHQVASSKLGLFSSMILTLALESTVLGLVLIFAGAVFLLTTLIAKKRLAHWFQTMAGSLLWPALVILALSIMTFELKILGDQGFINLGKFVIIIDIFWIIGLAYRNLQDVGIAPEFGSLVKKLWNKVWPSLPRQNVDK